MMNTSLKTNVSPPNIFVHIWRQMIIAICIINSYKIYPGLVALFLVLSYNAPVKDPSSIREIRSKYPSQSDSFWRTFVSGVDDVMELNRPSNILVMYRPQSEHLLNCILQDLSGYMVRELEANDKRPLIVEAHELNEPPFLKDYGEVVRKFGEELRTRHVMIVKNIDKVVGQVAQAFHPLCDEYAPYVEKAIIIFTLKVDEYPDKDYLFVENLLSDVWSDMEEDTFSPLVTRMLGMILRVNDATQTDIPNRLLNINLAPICIGFVFSLVLFFIRRHYTDIAHICYKYPHQRESIWENLSEVCPYDNFFFVSHDLDFLEALVKYLQKQLHLSSVITLREDDLEDIERYYKKNKKFLESGCVLLIENIEEVQGKLQKVFHTSSDVKTILEKYEFPVVYIVADQNIEDEESVLDETFVKLLPSKKVFR